MFRIESDRWTDTSMVRVESDRWTGTSMFRIESDRWALAWLELNQTGGVDTYI
jgi:hypothetical protein